MTRIQVVLCSPWRRSCGTLRTELSAMTRREAGPGAQRMSRGRQSGSIIKTLTTAALQT